MTAEEFRELVQEGDLVRIRAGETNVAGRVDRILSNDVKLIRLDSGRVCVVKITSIDTLDFDVDEIDESSRSVPAAPAKEEIPIVQAAPEKPGEPVTMTASETKPEPVAQTAPEPKPAPVPVSTPEAEEKREAPHPAEPPATWLPPEQGARKGYIISYKHFSHSQYGFIHAGPKSGAATYFRLEHLHNLLWSL